MITLFGTISLLLASSVLAGHFIGSRHLGSRRGKLLSACILVSVIFLSYNICQTTNSLLLMLSAVAANLFSGGLYLGAMVTDRGE